MNEFITNLLISLVYTRHKNITDLLKSNDYEYIISAIKDRDYATKERILEVLISSSYILNKSKKLEYFLNDALNTNRNLLYQGILKDELFLKNLLKNFYTLIDIRDNNLIEFRQKEYEALNDANTPLFKLNYQCFEKFYSLNDLLRRMLLETYNLAIKNGAAKDIAINYLRGMIVEGIDFFELSEKYFGHKQELKNYYVYMRYLVYSDVLKYLINLDNKNYEEKEMINLLESLINNEVNISYDDQYINSILQIFIDKDKNIKKDNIILNKAIKKANPLYFLDNYKKRN